MNDVIYLIFILLLASFKCLVKKLTKVAVSLNSGSGRVFFRDPGFDQNKVRDSGNVNGILGFNCYGRQDSPKFEHECGIHGEKHDLADLSFQALFQSPDNVSAPKSYFVFVVHVCIQDQGSSNFENDLVKISVHEANLTGL